MITLHYFAYQGDADFVVSTGQAVLTAISHSPYAYGKDITLAVVDDAANPCPQETRDKLKTLGISYRTSDFPRRGNLNGQECILGILHEFKKSLKRKKDIAVKLDCDTLILGTDWLQKFIADKNALITGADDRGCVYGMCYALKPALVDALIELFTRCPVGERAQEDIYLGSRARLLAKAISGDKGFLPIPIWLNTSDAPGFNGPHGQLIIYNWHQGLSLVPLYTGFQIVNVANGMLQGKTSRQDVHTLVGLLVSGRFATA